MTACVCLSASCLSAYRHEDADSWNERAYSFHYRNIDSVSVNAQRAYSLSSRYADGRAEALNNFAFVDITKMDYEKADRHLQEVYNTTDNQIELMVADVQMMRICQRQSENKDFYKYRERAVSRLNRIEEHNDELTPHQQKRLVYAQSEYAITLSTYLYYVGQDKASVESLGTIDPNGAVVKDTAQLLNYYYNVGAGGILSGNSIEGVAQTEFDYLMRCYLLSRQYNYPYWEANSMQAISEHLQDADIREILIRNNPQEVEFLDVDQMPDSLLAGNLAQRALNLFDKYGDVYQTAGAYRTLAECYWEICDYRSALICLNSALSKNKAVEKAPDLVASIREQLSLVYSAINDKVRSDYNRNIYLDIQEKTRQDRQLEARAEQLDQSLRMQNIMIGAVLLMIVAVGAFLMCLGFIRRKRMRTLSGEALLEPLGRWNAENERREEERQEKKERLEEETYIASVQLEKNKHRNIEQRAKVSLVNSIMPLINRMAHEVDKLKGQSESADIQKARYEYIAELTGKIMNSNGVLTRWIQMCRGDLQLHIESFRLQDVFDSLSRSKMEYKLKNIELDVVPTADVVKADKALTLFMVNTIAENARKFTPEGGMVKVESRNLGDCIEVSVEDTGIGMSEEQLSHLFEHKVIVDVGNEDDAALGKTVRKHGFGLMNCKGIIDKYRKLSSLFDKCMISAESRERHGTRIFFRLPVGVMRMAVVALLAGCCWGSASAATNGGTLGRVRRTAGTPASFPSIAVKAGAYADSAYFCNIDGNYEQTLAYADSCLCFMNMQYSKDYGRVGRQLVLQGDDADKAAELEWFHDSVRVDYNVILDVRNEVAVAALALHKWSLYQYNNKVYTQLFRECSADNTLADYVRMMQKSEGNKNVSIILLVFLFLMIFPAYYLLYYRHRLYYNLCVDKIKKINDVLLMKDADEAKLRKINAIWTDKDDQMVDTERFSQLHEIVVLLKKNISSAIDGNRKWDEQLVFMEDELRRIKFENAQLYVCNNVLDNCLSTLKHETMYYPSRISQLIDGGSGNLDAIAELVNYYRLLYGVFSAQAMRIVGKHFKFDATALGYMMSLLKRQNGGKRPAMEVVDGDSQYVVLRLHMPGLKLTQAQCGQFYTESTVDMNSLLCRQIVRDFGELTNARGCGIRARLENGEETVVEIKISKIIWKNSKLLS